MKYFTEESYIGEGRWHTTTSKCSYTKVIPEYGRTPAVIVSDARLVDTKYARYTEISESKAFKLAGKDDAHTVPMAASVTSGKKALVFFRPQDADHICKENRFFGALARGAANASEYED